MLVAPYDPLAIDFGSILAAPSLEHWCGTDAFGRDICSRLIYGSRTALVIGFASSFVGSTIGAIIGVASAYFGGRIDNIIQRLMDILLAFPLIVLALVVVAAFRRMMVGGVDMNLIIAIAIPIIPRVARVVRAAALSVRVMPYVDAARAAGYSNSRIIFRHMAPNVVAPYLIMLTAFIAQAILAEASLSFLGLGVAEPTAAWGLMLSGNAADFYREAPWMIISRASPSRLRCLRSTCSGIVAGLPRSEVQELSNADTCSASSFETPATRAPQDEGGKITTSASSHSPQR